MALKKILFPYELAADNRNAFMHAAKIANLTNAELIVLNVCNFEAECDIGELIYEKKLQKRLEEVSDEVLGLKAEYMYEYSDESNAIIHIDYEVVYGNIKSEILEFLKRKKIDLVVITSPEEERDEIQLTGNNLKTIFNSVDTPILVVPEHDNYSPIQKIGYATDLHRMKDSGSILSFAIHFAELFKAHTHFIHVSTEGKLSSIDDKDTFAVIEKLIKTSPSKYSFEVIRGEGVIQAVSKFIKKCPVDLVIVIKQNSIFFKAMFHESFTNQFSLYSKEPILILHEREDNKILNN
jgi:nucleotide-binding universal stress UspA family protein